MCCKLTINISSEIFGADCTGELPHISPDIIITDIPYGNLVDWNSDSENPFMDMLEQLVKISHRDTVPAVSMDKKQNIEHPAWLRKKKQLIGKREFEICLRVKLGTTDEMTENQNTTCIIRFKSPSA